MLICARCFRLTREFSVLHVHELEGISCVGERYAFRKRR